MAQIKLIEITKNIDSELQPEPNYFFFLFFSQPIFEVFPDVDLNNGWWLGLEAFGIPEFSITFWDEADEEGWMAESGKRGPNPNIGWRCIIGMFGCIAGLLAYGAEMLGWPTDVGIVGCLMFALTPADCANPADAAGRLVPACPNRFDIIRTRSAENLCRVLSTCSHSFKSKVSTSANCFSFSSNLFNCNQKVGIFQSHDAWFWCLALDTKKLHLKKQKFGAEI